jgi:hypothetical protein
MEDGERWIPDLDVAGAAIAAEPQTISTRPTADTNE